MSLLTVTAAQRQTLRDKASTLATLSQTYAESARTPTAEEAAIVQAAIDSMVAAIDVISGTGTARIANNAVVSIRNSAGNLSHPGTAVVSGSTLTGVNLGSSTAFADHGGSSAATGTGNIATFVVADGVIVRVTLSTGS